MKDEKIFLSWFGMLNFVLAILVVLIHTYNASTYGLEYGKGISSSVLWIEDYFSHNLAHTAVPLFFAISGYLYFRTVSFVNLKEKLKRRVYTLCIPYLIWNFIYFLLFFALSQIPFLRENVNSIQSISIDAPTIVSSLLFYKYNYIMWFIYQLIIYVFLLSPILILILRNNISIALTITILAIAYSMGFLEVPCLSEKNMAIGIYPDMLAYFFIGGALSKSNIFSLANGRLLGGAFILIAQIIWFLNYSGYKSWHYNVLNFCFCTFSILGIFMVLGSLKRPCPNLKLASCSFFIFTIHPFLLECVQKIIYLKLPHTNWSALIDYIISPAVTIIICLCIAMILKKYIPKVYSFLGGR